MPRQATRYDVHPSVPYAQAILAKLPERSGRTAEEWVRLLKKDGPAGDKERRIWLKSEYGIGGTTASMLVNTAAGRGAEDTDPKAYLAAAPGMVDAMYDGPKAGLRPIHDALIEAASALGRDIRICPCRTIVPIYREHVIAQIKPTTRTRIDLGLAMKGATKRVPKRLVPTGGLEKGDRITHRIPLATPEEIDAPVLEWLALAYDLDG